jgi:hypothetical protein
MCNPYFPAFNDCPSIFTSSANLIKVFSLAPALQGDSVAVPKPRLFIP